MNSLLKHISNTRKISVVYIQTDDLLPDEWKDHKENNIN